MEIFNEVDQAYIEIEPALVLGGKRSRYSHQHWAISPLTRTDYFKMGLISWCLPHYILSSWTLPWYLVHLMLAFIYQSSHVAILLLYHIYAVMHVQDLLCGLV